MELKTQKSPLFGFTGRVYYILKSQVDNRKCPLGAKIYCSYNQKRRVWEMSKDRVEVGGKMYLLYEMEGNNTKQLTNHSTNQNSSKK